MKIKFMILAFCKLCFGASLEESLNIDTNVSVKKESNKEISKQVFFSKPKEYHQEQGVDFDTFATNSLASVLNLSSSDQTQANVDFNALNVNIKNINSLIDYDNAVLLFEKQLRVNQNEQAYSAGFINRYTFDQFNFGFNFFNDQYSELNAKKSIGTEFQFSKIFKAYANHYSVSDHESDNSTELGVVFDLPYVNMVNVNTNIKETQKQYNIIYSPLSIIDLSLNYQDEKIAKDQTAMWIKFKFSYEKDFMQQIYQSWYNQNRISKFNKYDFATRNY
ncbi:hypothetical protein [Campylobacter insulaenigrae]|uniref:hypothetical protein n=1 Tax=Campylobacter insulaenigrae TaxID=260714 RepID=UPI0021535F9A|nr:hypothetical protein [Campylobacter insulaenigrae]MCR6594363.1 hypothetical protein [Campylobacter insulaenigrae]